MNYAILAAGEGSRLLQEGITVAKPLIKINNVTLIDRLISVFCKNNAESLSIIINEKMTEVNQYVKTLQLPTIITVNKVIKSTSSSMHSLFELSPFLKNGKCCISTVDTIFEESIFASFIRSFETCDVSIDGIMAVTDFIDDEKPLYVSFNKNTFEIEKFSDHQISQYISGGIYCLTPKTIELLPHCVNNGVSHMRNYQRQLLANHFKFKAFPFGKILDIDHASDISKAGFFFKKKPSPFQIIGVKRNHQYSPSHIDNDAAIFQLTTEQLKKMGCSVTVFTEKQLHYIPFNTTDLVFSMARHSQSIHRLKKLEDTGKKVINSGYGIENCTRENITKLMLANHIPMPQSFIVPTNNFSLSGIDMLGTHCWIKRGDFHALQKEDVSYIHTEEAEHVLHKYAIRGIRSAVVNEHLSGDLVKFYGVNNTDFFYWFYPDTSHSKFGMEIINGKAIGTPFDQDFLKKICTQIAEILNIFIYGGDCIISKNGEMKIIDFNDWPSFAPCRHEAAPYIAECIYNQL